MAKLYQDIIQAISALPIVRRQYVYCSDTWDTFLHDANGLILYNTDQFVQHDTFGNIIDSYAQSPEKYHTMWWPSDQCFGIVYMDISMQPHSAVVLEQISPTRIRHVVRFGHATNLERKRQILWQVGIREIEFETRVPDKVLSREKNRKVTVDLSPSELPGFTKVLITLLELPGEN